MVFTRSSSQSGKYGKKNGLNDLILSAAAEIYFRRPIRNFPGHPYIFDKHTPYLAILDLSKIT